jgi:hypothetical protein
MSPLERKGPQDEEREESRGPQFDLDARVCPVCREEVAAWVRTCPHDGAEVVRREDLPPPDDPLLARFLDDGEDRD